MKIGEKIKILVASLFLIQNIVNNIRFKKCWVGLAYISLRFWFERMKFGRKLIFSEKNLTYFLRSKLYFYTTWCRSVFSFKKNCTNFHRDNIFSYYLQKTKIFHTLKFSHFYLQLFARYYYMYYSVFNTSKLYFVCAPKWQKLDVFNYHSFENEQIVQNDDLCGLKKKKTHCFFYTWHLWIRKYAN